MDFEYIKIYNIIYMSQSDYIKLKKITSELKSRKYPPTLTSDDYTKYGEYHFMKNVVNTKNRLSLLIQPSPLNQTIYDMNYNVSNCTNTIMCKDTNNRPNRVLNSIGFLNCACITPPSKNIFLYS